MSYEPVEDFSQLYEHDHYGRHAAPAESQMMIRVNYKPYSGRHRCAVTDPRTENLPENLKIQNIARCSLQPHMYRQPDGSYQLRCY